MNFFVTACGIWWQEVNFQLTVSPTNDRRVYLPENFLEKEKKKKKLVKGPLCRLRPFTCFSFLEKGGVGGPP